MQGIANVKRVWQLTRRRHTQSSSPCFLAFCLVNTRLNPPTILLQNEYQAIYSRNLKELVAYAVRVGLLL